MQLREEGEVSAASGGPLQEGNVVPAPNPRPLRTHNLIILSRNVGLPLGRVRVTHSTCLAGGWGDVRFLCREPWMTWKRLVGDRIVSCLPAGEQKRRGQRPGFGQRRSLLLYYLCEWIQNKTQGQYKISRGLFKCLRTFYLVACVCIYVAAV